MRLTPSICAEDLGPKAAALVVVQDGHPLAVLNTALAANVAMQDRAQRTLTEAGFTPGQFLGAVDRLRDIVGDYPPPDRTKRHLRLYRGGLTATPSASIPVQVAPPPSSPPGNGNDVPGQLRPKR